MKPLAPTPAWKKPAKRWDVALSVLLLGVAGLLVGLAPFVGLFTLAFLDDCPPASCSTSGAVYSWAGGFLVALAVYVYGVVDTVNHSSRRQYTWPVALATLFLTVLALAATVVAFLWSVKH